MQATGSSTADYTITSNKITLADKQTSATVPVSIVDDSLPEFNETFTVMLDGSSVQGGAVIGSPSSCVVTIMENDYPYGLIGKHFMSGDYQVHFSAVLITISACLGKIYFQHG